MLTTQLLSVNGVNREIRSQTGPSHPRLTNQISSLYGPNVRTPFGPTCQPSKGPKGRPFDPRRNVHRMIPAEYRPEE